MAVRLSKAWKHHWDQLMAEVMPEERVCSCFGTALSSRRVIAYGARQACPASLLMYSSILLHLQQQLLSTSLYLHTVGDLFMLRAELDSIMHVGILKLAVQVSVYEVTRSYTAEMHVCREMQRTGR